MKQKVTNSVFLGFFILLLLGLGIFYYLQNAGSDTDSVNQPVSTSLTWVGAGDIAQGHPQTEATAKLLDKIEGTIFITGDLAYPVGSLENFFEFYDPTWGRHKSRTKPTPGNHEYQTPNAQGYFTYFPELKYRNYYSYKIGSWLILALNSENLSMDQEVWLKRELAKHENQTCTAAYWHRPLFSSGPHGNNPDIKKLWDILYANRVDVVVNGHDHIYERFAEQNPQGQLDEFGIRQFTAGTGGAKLYQPGEIASNSEKIILAHGVLKFELLANSYSWQFIPIDGETDSGSENCD